MYWAVGGAANAAADSPATLVAVSPVCVGVDDGSDDGVGGSAGVASASLVGSAGRSGCNAGVIALSPVVGVFGSDVAGGWVCCCFAFEGLGSLTVAVLAALGCGGATSGVGTTGVMVRVLKALLAVLGVAGRRFKEIGRASCRERV